MSRTVLAEAEWRGRQLAHTERVRPWIQPRLERRAKGAKHPVDDFLFEYYPFTPARLATWHPGMGTVLAPPADEIAARPAYRRIPDGVEVNPDELVRHRPRLSLVRRLLAGSLARPAQLSCFGLHEWAMVYGQSPSDVRHADQPLRLSPEDVKHAVDGLGLRCTHIDAYRFFTPAAIPLNSVAPTRAAQPDLEQAGCLHASMDLYKYAMWFQPWVGSDLVADAFALAREARVLDMQASPYDCTDLGLDPIPVETPAGRAEYVRRQRLLMDAATPLRSRLLERIELLTRAD